MNLWHFMCWRKIYFVSQSHCGVRDIRLFLILIFSYQKYVIHWCCLTPLRLIFWNYLVFFIRSRKRKLLWDHRGTDQPCMVLVKILGLCSVSERNDKGNKIMWAVHEAAIQGPVLKLHVHNLSSLLVRCPGLSQGSVVRHGGKERAPQLAVDEEHNEQHQQEKQ